MLQLSNWSFSLSLSSTTVWTWSWRPSYQRWSDNGGSLHRYTESPLANWPMSQLPQTTAQYGDPPIPATGRSPAMSAVGPGFKYRPRHYIYMVLLSTSQATSATFYILSNSLFATNPIIRRDLCLILSLSKNHNKPPRVNPFSVTNNLQTKILPVCVSWNQNVHCRLHNSAALTHVLS